VAFVLGCGFQVLERIAPELAQPLAQFAQAIWSGSVQASSAGAPLGDQARLTQDAQVLRYSWPGDVGEVRGNFSRRALAIAHQTQDGAATGIGESVEHGAVKHSAYLSTCF
jgi:hypothetical protein